MSDEILQRYRREALQGDAAALQRLEAEILRRRIGPLVSPYYATEIIEILHPFKGPVAVEPGRNYTRPIATALVTEITDEKVVIAVHVSAVHDAIDPASARMVQNAVATHDPEPSRRPSWSPLHVCGMFCDGQDSNSRCEVIRLARCCVCGEIPEEGVEIQIGRRSHVYCERLHEREAERLQSDADDVLAQDGCTLCNGTGRSPGNENVTCPGCGGDGELAEAPWSPAEEASPTPRCPRCGRFVQRADDSCGWCLERRLTRNPSNR